jgi:hydroxyacylglutathione hydrolase
LIRLSRIGFDNSIGFLEGGFESWFKSGKQIDKVDRITPKELEEKLNRSDISLLDVRKKSEFESEHVEGAINIPLNQLENKLSEFPFKENFIINCAGGYRSMIAASILKRHGIHKFVDVIGGMSEISKTSISLTDYICPTTLL